MSKKTVIIGLLGTVLDSGGRQKRWQKWRPTVSLCDHKDFHVDRIEILHQTQFANLYNMVAADINTLSPTTIVSPQHIAFDDPWDFEQVYAALLDFARSYPFKPEEEEYLIHITTGTHVAQICLFLLTESHYFPAKLLQSAPLRRGLTGAGTYSIVDLDLSKYDRLASRFNQEVRESTSFLKSGIDTRNERFNALIDQIEHVAVRSKSPVLLTGPTGAGKSQLARRIFELKKHRRQVQGKFVEVNCATIRGDWAMSALFGHVRGAFTGAIGERAGLLRAADGGLLFLDEVGELGLDEQAMLLRAVEEKRFLPVGSDKELTSDFQLIAGTNRDLRAAVASGKFREDLLARIDLWLFQLPGLSERRDDIEPNLDYELEQFARRHGSNVTLNREARQRFLELAGKPNALWNGNFRDLNAAVTRMATLAPGGRITVEIVHAEFARLQSAWKTIEPAEDALPIDESMLSQLDPFDRCQLAEVIRVCRRCRSLSDAGRQLFAVSRTKKGTANDADRLRKYLARYGLEFASLQDVS